MLRLPFCFPHTNAFMCFKVPSPVPVWYCWIWYVKLDPRILMGAPSMARGEGIGIMRTIRWTTSGVLASPSIIWRWWAFELALPLTQSSRWSTSRWTMCCLTTVVATHPMMYSGSVDTLIVTIISISLLGTAEDVISITYSHKFRWCFRAIIGIMVWVMLLG